MKTKLQFLLFILLLIISGCGNDDPVNPPQTGEVLVAQVAGDSIGISNGSSTRTISISSQSLDFTDRDYIRITMYYSGQNNQSTSPFSISYLQDTNTVEIFNGNNWTITPTETYIDTTFASPRVNKNFRYRINTFNTTQQSYIKFRDLKIYKK